MARRIIIDQGTSRLAIWARRLALFSLAAAVLSIIIVHSGVLEMRPALATFGAALALAVLALVLAFAAFVSIWKDGLHRHGRVADRDRHCGPAAGLSVLPRGRRRATCRGSTTSPPIRSTRRATTRSPRRGRATPIPSSMPALPRPSSSSKPIPTSSRSMPTSTRAPPTSAALTVINRRRWRVVEAARARSGPAGGAHRGGGAHTDHGFPRRRHRAGAAVRGRRPRRRALLVALRHVRFRRQCRARAPPARRHRVRDRPSSAGRAPPIARPKGQTKGTPKAPAEGAADQPRSGQAKR